MLTSVPTADAVWFILQNAPVKVVLVILGPMLISAFIGAVTQSRHDLSFPDLAFTFCQPLSQPYDPPSRKFRTVLVLSACWVSWYAPACFVTQLWAGNEYSPGQGYGLPELLTWSVLFGAVTIAGAAVMMPHNGSHGLLTVAAVVVGYLIGSMVALARFVPQDGPNPGDWWWAPAFSCAFVLVVVAQLRISVIRRTPDLQDRAWT